MVASFNSELERTNLEVHVDMSRQRYMILEEKVETLDERMDELMSDLGAFRKEHANNITELKELQAASIHTLREESASNAQSTTKIFVGAAATVIGGLLSVMVVLLVSFL